MENNQTQPSLQFKKSHMSKGFKVVLISLGTLVLVGLSAYGVYVWQQSKVNELQSKVDQLEATKNTPKSPTSNTNATQLSEDDKVTAAFNQYCDAIKIPDGYERNTVIGTMTADQKKFVYSADGQFVALNGKCDFIKKGETDQGGGAAAHLFKKVNDNWQVVVVTQQRPDDASIEKYGIPEDFLIAIGLN